MEDGKTESTLRFRWWYLPSWLGLDAPVVVTSWATMIALTIGFDISSNASLSSLAALFAATWSIYLLDRIVDVAQCTDWSDVTGRMLFGRVWLWVFKLCLAIALVGLGSIAFWGAVPNAVFFRGFFVAIGMLIYATVFVIPSSSRRLWGKEFGVGLFFSFGAYAVIGAPPGIWFPLTGLWVLVSFNCLVIAARETKTDARIDHSGASRWWSTLQRDLLWIGCALAVCCGAIWWFSASETCAALTVAFVLLTLLHGKAKRHSADATRALADFCLLPPWFWIAKNWLGS